MPEQKPAIALNKINIPNTGECFVDLTPFEKQEKADGLIIINLNDVLPWHWIKEVLFGYTTAANPNTTPKVSLSHPTVYDKLRLGGTSDWLEYLTQLRARGLCCVFYLDLSSFPKQVSVGQVTQVLNIIGPGWGYLVALKKDAFQLRCFGPKSYLTSQLVVMTRYMSRDFYNNIYLAGRIIPLELAHLQSYKNTNFLAVLAYNYIFLDLDSPFWGSIIKSELPLPMAYNFYNVEYITLATRLKSHKQHLLKELRDGQAGIKQAITRLIKIESGVNNYIIGANIDSFFDIQILNGLKTILRELKPEKKKEAFNPFNSMFSDDTSIEIKVIGVMDGQQSGENPITSSLLKSLALGPKPAGGFMIHYVPISVVRFEPLIEKLGFFEATAPTIWLLMNSGMTQPDFQNIVNKIVEKKSKPGVTLRTFYLDYNVNTYLRQNLAYYNYLSKISNDTTMDVVRLFAIYNNNLKKKKEPVVEQPDDKACCTCCNCLSRNGIKYMEIKYLPYLDDIVISFIEANNDIWVPRI